MTENLLTIHFPKQLLSDPLCNYLKKEEAHLNIYDEDNLTQLNKKNHLIVISNIESLQRLTTNILLSNHFILYTDSINTKLISTLYLPFLSILPKDNLKHETVFDLLNRIQKIHPLLQAKETLTHFPIKKQKKTLLIPIENIYYFLAESKYLSIKHTEGEDLALFSLSKLEKALPSHFIRVHRNALVSKKHIKSVNFNTNSSATISFKEIDNTISISKRKIKEVRKSLETTL